MPPHTILLSGNPIWPQEKLASEPILPGKLVEFVPSGGDQGQLRLHATAGGNAMPSFAFERLTPDRANTNQAIDTTYADGETMRWMIGRPGDMVYAWLKPAAAAVVEGTPLVSGANGNLQPAAATAATEATSAAIVGMAAEAIDNSGGGTAVRCRVRVR